MIQLSIFPPSSALSLPPPPAAPPPITAAAAWVGEYDVARGRYLRYYWMDGDRTRHRHIRGSALGTTTGELRRRDIERAIACGMPPREICLLIENLPRGRRQRWATFERGQVAAAEV